MQQAHRQVTHDIKFYQKRIGRVWLLFMKHWWEQNGGSSKKEKRAWPGIEPGTTPNHGSLNRVTTRREYHTTRPSSRGERAEMMLYKHDATFKIRLRRLSHEPLHYAPSGPGLRSFWSQRLELFQVSKYSIVPCQTGCFPCPVRAIGGILLTSSVEDRSPHKYEYNNYFTCLKNTP